MTHVYVAAIGHEDCDALAGIVGCSAEHVIAQLDEIERQEFTDYRNSYCDADCADDCEHVERFSIWRVGPFPESALSVMRGVKSARGTLYSIDWDDVRHGALVY